jgi:phosphohistidine swiveling domain-containing protein
MDERVAGGADEDVLDVLHEQSPPDIEWSRVNIAEAMVGVQTPLSWTLWRSAAEQGFRRAFRRLGLIPKAGLALPRSTAESFTASFYGHAAFNVTAYARAISAMPGSATEATQESFFGESRSGRATKTAGRKVQARLGLALNEAVLPWWLARLRRQSHSWSRARLDDLQTADRDRAVAIFREVVDRMPDETRAQVVSSTIAGLAHSRLHALLERTGTTDLEMRVLGGHGSTEEARMAEALWDIAHGRGDIDAFLREYGFHGPAEGELSSPAWREDPAPVRASIAAFATMADGEGPRAAGRRAVADRVAAERQVSAGLGRSARWPARLVLWRARRSIPLRVVAKAAFTQTFDVARAAARVIGADLARTGALTDADDVFHLTVDEIGDLPADLHRVVAVRRARRESYLDLELPGAWTGMPIPETGRREGTEEAVAAPGAATSVDDVVTGLGVSAGVTEGLARVVLDVDDQASLEPGEILVCHTTDPSWTSSFVIASAVVIDIGGVLSHGAIVARELGIPGVVNTTDGTTRLRSGDRVRVDGTAGTVRVLARGTGDAG